MVWEAIKDALDWFCFQGTGYQFWSGIGSGSPILAGFVVYFRHHNCHVNGCWRLGHVDPEHGHPACWKHSSRAHKLGKPPVAEHA